MIIGLLVAALSTTGLASMTWARALPTATAPRESVQSPTPPEPVVAPVVRREEPLRRIGAFLRIGFGELRRTYNDVPGAGLFGAPGRATFSDPEVVVKGGAVLDVTPFFQIAPGIGAGVNADEGGTQGLVEVEFNFTILRGGYVGTGVGWWDFNDSSNDDWTVLAHAGIPLARNSRRQVRLLFVVEGRLFGGQLDDISNNYQYGAGFRWVFR
jgi:hypothetical protein